MIVKMFEIKKGDHGIRHGCPPQVNAHGQL